MRRSFDPWNPASLMECERFTCSGAMNNIRERKRPVTANARNSGIGVRSCIDTFEGEKRTGVMTSTRGEQRMPTKRVVKVESQWNFFDDNILVPSRRLARILNIHFRRIH